MPPLTRRRTAAGKSGWTCTTRPRYWPTKVDEALSKCKKELDKDEKNRVKADLANLRRCLRKDKPEKMNETEEAALRQAKSQLEASANHLMVLYTSQTEQDASGNDTAGSV